MQTKLGRNSSLNRDVSYTAPVATRDPARRTPKAVSQAGFSTGFSAAGISGKRATGSCTYESFCDFPDLEQIT